MDLSTLCKASDVAAASDALVPVHSTFDLLEAVETMLADEMDHPHKRQHRRCSVDSEVTTMEMARSMASEQETLTLEPAYFDDASYKCPETGLLLQDDHTGPTVVGTTRKLARRGARKRTLVLWDWDDTLFPSSWVLLERKLCVEHEVSEEDLAALDAVAQAVEATLNEMARWKAEVLIVTNAEEGWVQQSCARFFPRLLPYLDTFRVISARNTYSGGSKNPVLWKARALGAEVVRFCTWGCSNLIFIGDSAKDRQSAWHIAEAIDPERRRVKSVKLEELPTLECLQRTHEVLLAHLHTCWIHDGDADLAVYVDPADPAIASLIPYSTSSDRIPESPDSGKHS